MEESCGMQCRRFGGTRFPLAHSYNQSVFPLDADREQKLHKSSSRQMASSCGFFRPNRWLPGFVGILLILPEFPRFHLEGIDVQIGRGRLAHPQAFWREFARILP